MEIEQMHVKTAFLHGDLEETIFMAQPEGWDDHIAIAICGCRLCRGLGQEKVNFCLCAYMCRRTDQLEVTTATNYSFVDHRGKVYCIGRSWKGSNLAQWLGKSNGNHPRLCEAEV
ncbi:unnamed protein product [Prunus armeniaca]